MFGSTYGDASQLTDRDWTARLTRADHRDCPLSARIDGSVVGMAWVRLESSATEAHLFQMWVAPAHRRSGAAMAMLASAIEWARERGATALILSVTAGNSSAGRLYGAAGFQRTGATEPLREGSALIVEEMRLVLH